MINTQTRTLLSLLTLGGEEEERWEDALYLNQSWKKKLGCMGRDYKENKRFC